MSAAPLTAPDDEPLIMWDWIGDHTDEIVELTITHLVLALLPIVFGLAIALPLGLACRRLKWLYAPSLTVANIFYAIPSLALFMLMIQYFGSARPDTGSFQILVKEDFTLIIPLTLFSLSVLLPNVVDGLRSVPDEVTKAATAMGFGEFRRLLQVDLPIAVPVIIAGVRVATVASISLVSVGGIIGNGALGQYIIDGYTRDFSTQIITGAVLVIALALAADALLVGTQRVLTPWARRRTS